MVRNVSKLCYFGWNVGIEESFREITRGVVNFQKRCLAVLQNSVPSDEGM